MKRHSSSAFSTAILAMALAVAGLVSTTPAQAQTYKYGPSGINPQQNVWIQITGTQAEFRGDFRGAYVGTMNTSVPSGPGVQNAVNFQVFNPDEGNDYQQVVGWVSSTQFYINHPNGTWNLNLESGGPATYTVSYDANGATSGTAPGSQTKTHDVTLTLASNSGNLAKTDYTFAGWNTAANGLGTDYAAGGNYTANAAVTLYAKWTAVAAAPTIANAAASGVTASSATLNGNLTSTGTASTTVYVYWGTVDLGQTTSGWDGSQNLGVRSPGAVSHPISGLSGGTPYFYRFFAQNSVGSDWGDPATQFETASAPTVDNAAADNIGVAGARLNGALTQGGSATATVYWGPTDGGTTPGSWSNSVSLGTVSEGPFSTDISGLTETTTYFYRSYAQNAYGSDWADSTASFATLAKPFSDWNCKMQITFSGYSKSSTLADFPVLVVLNQELTGFLYSQFQTAGAGDLRFTDANDVELSYQIEEWNPAGNSYVWVQVPQLVNSSSYIWAYWGKAGATAPGYTTDGSTWANGFVGVWHLNEDGTGARSDSSPNNNDGIPCAYSGAEATVGLIGGADNLDGTTNCIRIPNNVGLQLNERLSLSAWVKADIWDTVNENVIIRKSSGYRLLCRDTGFMTLKLESAPDVIAQDPIANYSAGAWYHLVATYDKDANIASLYTNGVLAASTPGNTSLLSNDTDDPYIGSSDGAGQFFNGIIDEARICNLARSADWVWACYENQRVGSTFCGYATVQGGGITDNDGDGMDDGWETTYLGGTNAALGGAMEDRDSDGFSNLHEYIAGTDPTNAASLLKVVQVSSPGTASNFVLDWPSVAGKVYSVKRIADLMTPPWQTVASSIAATPPMNVYTVSVTGVKSGFYRVNVQQ